MEGDRYKHSDNTTRECAFESVCGVHCGCNPSLAPDGGAFEVSSLNLIPPRITALELYFYFTPLTTFFFFFKFSEINSLLDSISRFPFKTYFKATASHLFHGYLLSSFVRAVFQSHPSLLGSVPREAEL